MKSFNLNGISIHSFSSEELEQSIFSILSSDKEPQIITTFNLDFFRIAEKNIEFLKICKNSLWNLPDGSGITFLIKSKYKNKINRITGNDIFLILIELAKKHNYKVAIIGGKQEVLKMVEEKIKREFEDNDKNLLCISPEYLFEENDNSNREIIDLIADFKPKIIFAALGCPRQEIWLYKNMGQFASTINIGIGAVLDYYSGYKKRSPLFLQDLGLEWLWRLTQEPKRLFKRYILWDFPFFIRKVFQIYFNK